MAQPTEIPAQIVSALRNAAARAAELSGGGCALLFAAADPAEAMQSGAPLRAAAGFPSADTARAAAGALAHWVGTVVANGSAASAPPLPELGPRAAAGVSLLPIAWDGVRLGALAVTAPASLDPRVVQALAQIAATSALQIDHARLSGALESLRGQLDEKPEPEPEPDGDELLRLSEQLFAQDIELLRNTEKLGKIEKLKNDFIEKMSRELRTPLNNIIEAIISIIAGENEHLSEASLGSLRRALDEGTAFQRTLQNILDLWRIKQGEMPLEMQEVNFLEVAEEAIFSVQETVGGKPVTIEKQFPEALPKLRTDLAKVNQILFLLLDNAAKFIESGRIVIAARVESGQLICTVSDTGIGICPDDQELVFDEFFQVDDMGSTRYRGAGLGLTLVRDLLVLLDGEISVNSEAGTGTAITFAVPVEEL